MCELAGRYFVRDRSVRHLVPNEQLLNSSEIFKWREKYVGVLWTTDIFDKATKLVTESCENLVLVFNRLCEIVS